MLTWAYDRAITAGYAAYYTILLISPMLPTITADEGREPELLRSRGSACVVYSRWLFLPSSTGNGYTVIEVYLRSNQILSPTKVYMAINDVNHRVACV